MRISLILVFWGFSLISVGQNLVIKEHEVERRFADEYNERGLRSENKDSAYLYFNRAMLISQELNYPEGQIDACKGLLKLYERDPEIYEKLRYSLMLVNLYNKYGSPDERAGAYFSLGNIYADQQLFSKAAETFARAVELKIRDKALYFNSYLSLVCAHKYAGQLDEALVASRSLEVRDMRLPVEQLVILYREKAEIYHELKAYEQELEAYRKILEVVKGTKYVNLEAATWNNMGYTWKFIGNYPKAKSYFLNTIRKGGGDDDLLGAAWYNLGVIYQNERDADSALLSFSKANNCYGRLKNKQQQAKCHNMEALVYYHVNDQFNALKAVDQAILLAKREHYPAELSKSYEIRSFIHQDLFEFENALDYYKMHLSIRDSLLVEERAHENKLLFDQYRIEQTEKQLRLIWAKNEIDVINLAKEKAEKEAERERFNAREKEDQLRIADLQNKELRAMQELQRLMLLEEKLNSENQQKELALIQRDNELKELALEKERLVVSENEKAISLLAQKNELERQKRLNEEQEFNNKMRLILGALLFILLILLGILIAYRQLRKRKKRIEQQALIIAESKRVIEKEKENSESLLLNILPHAVADELKTNGSAKPRLYQEVSVGFTDFSGFTMISEKLSPEELVHKLDEIFYQFDLIIEKYGLQRIKTIGDAYMFASGLPEETPDHASKIVEAALDIRDYIEVHNRELSPNEENWNIRIGVNTGPVVAGVIGIKKFAYDIWGDTVNLAARMESSGEIGKVNISGSTYDLVKDQFSTEYRGKIAAKNKGEVDMYFVERRA